MPTCYSWCATPNLSPVDVSRFLGAATASVAAHVRALDAKAMQSKNVPRVTDRTTQLTIWSRFNGPLAWVAP